MRKLVGVAMGMMMMLAACGGGQLKTFTFYSSQSVTIPSSVNNLVALTGRGGDGQPAYVDEYYDVEIVTTLNYSNGTTTTNTTYSSGSGTAPSDYCQGLNGNGPNGPYTGTRCYYHTQHYDEVPPSTGSSTTAFGKTFPGGLGGAATPVTYNNVAVTPGPNSLVIPSGGSVTFSYYE